MNLGAPAELEPNEDYLATYRLASAAGYDEAIDRDGNVRPHWQALLSAFFSQGSGKLGSRAERLLRRVRETGIDFDIFAHPTAPTQNWRLDLAPVLISPTEWRKLEQALSQRARLMDAILHDIYGEQRLMREGLVPPELVFADPTYLRPCQGILSNAGPLRFFAADLARDHNGQWRVIDNHSETLAGIGFAVANRVVHSHVAGDWFRRCNAVRLAPFFQNVQSALTAHAGRENARVALLTPGPQHQDYFSHAYLARYLGYLLVEGPDLRTRGNQVFLKTLEGLKEIDLIVRCVDGRFVDPLELDPSGFLGAAGLLRVNRAHPRLVVNAVGSAVIQNRGFGPYLARLARTVLGEELLLPDARRHWLGDAKVCRSVLDDLNRFVIRSAQEGTGRPGQATLGQEPRNLHRSDRANLTRTIALGGAGLVAEEEFGLSHSPVFDGNTLTPRSFAIRFFVARTEHGFEVMPGGLAMSADPGRTVALSTVDGHTRDVWVLSDTEQRHHASLWRPMLENARVERSQRVIQSRVADDLYWLGRYHERADWTMRVLRGAYRRIEEDSDATDGLSAAYRILQALLDMDLPRGKRQQPDDDDVESLCTRLIRGQQGSRTLTLTCDSLYRCASLARDRLSFEAWSALSRFRPGDGFISNISHAAPSEILDSLDEGLAALAAFNGLMHENMTRNFGWRFLDLGRRIERAYNLCESIATVFSNAEEPEDEMNALRLILELADSFITYRSRYRIDPSLPLVLDLLLLDETNPRSLAFQLTAASAHLDEFPGAHRGTTLPDDRRLLLAALTAVRLADVEAVAAPKGRGRLERLMAEQLDLLPELSNAIGRRYFNLTDDVPHRVQMRSESNP